MTSGRAVLLLGACLAAIGLPGCSPPDQLRQLVADVSPREEYVRALQEAGLQGTALYQEWTQAGARAIAAPVEVSLPLRETGFFPATDPQAVGYKLELRRGQRLHVTVEIEAVEPAQLFLDLLELSAQDEPRVVASGGEGELALEFDADEDGTFVLRLQPELLRELRFTVVQQAMASLIFPVPERESVGSGYGAPRNGGARSHEGIDIFAPRDTPAVAAADGIVSNVGTNNLGGLVVWIWVPDRRLSLYYAHLSEQLVRTGQRVTAGQPVGLVGNTGNARTTAPHLHFGVYRRGEGAVDPVPFVLSPSQSPAPVRAALESLGQPQRVTVDLLNLRSGPDTDAQVIAQLARHEIVEVAAASATWYRVRRPDETSGYVAARYVEDLREPIRRARLTTPTVFRSAPDARAPVVARLGEGASIAILGRHDAFLFVRPGGMSAWVPRAAVDDL